MKNMDINIEAEINTGNKDFTSYTMDLTKKYIEINTDYRTQNFNKKIFLNCD